MNDLLQEIAASPLILVLGLLASIISIPLAIYFGIKSRRFKQLAYVAKSVSFIRDYEAKIAKLEVRYGVDKIRNLTITKIAIWNIGTETIQRADIAGADPLRIHCDGTAQILDIEMLASASANNVRVGHPKEFMDGAFFDHLH